ncbi:MAG: (deoxy)nucleoside triphosphate pyrophosphohydrolase [Nocardioides sp.]
MDDALPDAVTLVVGAAIVHAGRVLAARRTSPPEAAGRWELPGGKAETGESLADAVVREIREELGCDIAVAELLEGAQPIRPGYALRVAVATLVAGEPVPREHDAVRWLRADQLDDVDWLTPDLPFLTTVRSHLAKAAP